MSRDLVNSVINKLSQLDFADLSIFKEELGRQIDFLSQENRLHGEDKNDKFSSALFIMLQKFCEHYCVQNLDSHRYNLLCLLQARCYGDSLPPSPKHRRLLLG
ncbi:hypothetical protein ACOSQ2_021411 [Xanthoceras sorbifolium]